MNRSEDSQNTQADLSIKSGMAHLYFAFDVGFSINLEETVRRITVGAAQPPVYSRPRTNKYLKLTPSPVRISQAFPEHPVFSSFKTQPQAEALVFEFGAISVALRVPFSGSLPHVTQFIQSIYANESLKQYARSFLDQILIDIAPAITKMSVSPQVEDYFVFQIINCEPVMETEDLIAQHSGTIACMLRGETAPLAEEEIHEIMANRVSYGKWDVSFIDWDSAIVFDPEAKDICMVLEHTNVALLEFSFLNQNINQALNEFYVYLQPARHRFPAFFFKSLYPQLQKTSQFQLDTEIIFESVTNSLKLFGDVFLARLYDLSSRQLGLEDWQESINRKIQTVESLYSKLSQEESNRRLEILEWIIIILITVSILIPFIPGLPH